ncbi:hypothetical protein [Pallidibacillus thermolactis]|jgi:hypothetical protein|uniref:hypothetical protein n=1 Tax=Pallidibacillus thermolactis TaxID=251051 RepID=UPI0021DAEFFC|nr:hypothetical protein [Pallidibacillus thermolactis]MCU9602770.1 hypothetical protein [Pallidibacillus thermolactis subsp. kokeshiiformis]MED1674724.1 hypothetical protein [Pallidibacillus thermolactis subsp. kokeshiiformis]
MKYIKISLIVFLISFCLFLISFFTKELKYGFIVSGIIINYIGVVMVIIGGIKRSKNSN